MDEMTRTIRDMEALASEVIESAGGDSDGALDVARDLALRVRSHVDRLQEVLDGGTGKAGAYWMMEALKDYYELRFTLNDPDARSMGLGGAHDASEFALEYSAFQGRKRWRHQRENASKAAQKRWGGDGRDALDDIIRRLAARKDAMGDHEPPGELWDALYGELDDAGLSPRESADDAYRYDGDEGTPLTYEAFRKRISRLRR